jgi:hypothetical protein
MGSNGIGRPALAAALCAAVASAQAAESDRDGDGLSDFQEIHKYGTDPDQRDTDGDGVPDGDWLERREYQYWVRTVVQVMRPVTPEYLNDDWQDVRVLDATADHVELEVIHYPFPAAAAAIAPDPQWRQTAAAMPQWTAPGPTADWTPAMRAQLLAALQRDGIDAGRLDDKALVEAASRWLCKHAQYHDGFSTFVVAFDGNGQPFVPDDLRARAEQSARELGTTLPEQWQREISARGMFEHGMRGSCSSTAIYLDGCLRALGVPTRIVLCIPVVDAGDAREVELLRTGLSHHALRHQVTAAIAQLQSSWASHTFNEVFVGGRWRRLNGDRLGQGIADRRLFGLITHVATFSDWADARMPETIGRRQQTDRPKDLFGGRNPYSTIALRDAFGPHCKLPNPPDGAPVPSIEELSWCDDPALPEAVRGWFAKHGVFGLVARVEGLDSAELTGHFEHAHNGLVLRADGKPDLHVALDPGNRWGDGDRSLVVVPFGPADRRDLATGVEYRVALRDQAAAGDYSLAPDLRVLRK